MEKSKGKGVGEGNGYILFLNLNPHHQKSPVPFVNQLCFLFDLSLIPENPCSCIITSLRSFSYLCFLRELVNFLHINRDFVIIDSLTPEIPKFVMKRLYRFCFSGAESPEIQSKIIASFCFQPKSISKFSCYWQKVL